MHVAVRQNQCAGVAERMCDMSVRFLKSAGAAALAAVLLFPGVASAQATLAGALRDTSGAVLPGVTVEASSNVLIEGARTTVTDGTGQYRIVALPPRHV